MPEEIADRPVPDVEAEATTPVLVHYALQANRSSAELDRIDRLDVGRAAIRRSVQEGFLSAQEERLSLQSIRNIYQVRIALETLAVELVAAQPMPDLQGCWNEIFRMQEAAEDGRALSFYQADFAFHRALWKASLSASLNACLQDIVTKLMSFSINHRVYPAPGRLMEMAILHRKMLEMIAVGNVEAAVKLMAESMKNDQHDDEQLAGVI